MDRKIFTFNLLIIFLLSMDIAYSEKIAVFSGEGIDFFDTDHPEECMELAHSWERDSCYNVNLKFLKGEDICDTGIFPEQYCALDPAERNESIEICEIVETDKHRWKKSFTRCYTYFAVKQNDPSICDKSDDPPHCYFSVAVNLGDINLCVKTEDKESCIWKVAKKNQKLSECTQAGWAKTACYRDVAIIREDEKLCEKVAEMESEEGQICFEGIDLKRSDKKRFYETFGLCEDIIPDVKKVDNFTRFIIITAVILAILLIAYITYCWIKKTPRNATLLVSISVILFVSLILIKENLDSDTLNEKFCNNLDYCQSQCFAKLAKIKDKPDVCLNNRFYEYDDGNCLRQFLNKSNNPKICSVILIREDKDEEYDRCLKDILDSEIKDEIYDLSICELMKIETNRETCVARLIEKEKIKNETISLFIKYKDVLKDKEALKHKILNPENIDFCKLLTVLTKDRTINDLDKFESGLEDNHPIIICLGMYGKNNGTGCMLDAATWTWKGLCGGGLFFNKVDECEDRKCLISVAAKFSYSEAFPQGLGVAAANTDFNVSSFLAPIKENFYESTEDGIVVYDVMKKAAENLEPFNFCDEIKHYKKECENIVKI